MASLHKITRDWAANDNTSKLKKGKKKYLCPEWLGKKKVFPFSNSEFKTNYTFKGVSKKKKRKKSYE